MANKRVFEVRVRVKSTDQEGGVLVRSESLQSATEWAHFVIDKAKAEILSVKEAVLVDE